MSGIDRLGLGVMIGMLAGNADSANAFTKALNKKIAKIYDYMITRTMKSISSLKMDIMSVFGMMVSPVAKADGLRPRRISITLLEPLCLMMKLALMKICLMMASIQNHTTLRRSL